LLKRRLLNGLYGYQVRFVRGSLRSHGGTINDGKYDEDQGKLEGMHLDDSIRKKFDVGRCKVSLAPTAR
jgi:hypothetical protein